MLEDLALLGVVREVYKGKGLPVHDMVSFDYVFCLFGDSRRNLLVLFD